MPYTVYIVECNDQTLYTGITTDIKRRIDEHNGIAGNEKSAAKYTRARCPVKLVYSESYASRSTASKRESEIKKMTRVKKLALISL